MKSFISLLPVACLVAMVVVTVKAAPAPVDLFENGITYCFEIVPERICQTNPLHFQKLNSCAQFDGGPIEEVNNNTPYTVKLYKDNSCSELLTTVDSRRTWDFLSTDSTPVAYYIVD